MGPNILDRIKGWHLKKTISSLIEKEERGEIIVKKIAEQIEKISERAKDQGKMANSIKNVESIFFKNPQGLKLLERIINNMHPNCRKKFFGDFLIRASVLRPSGYYKYEKKYGCPAPYTILISPTMRCNLRCVGCYANQYSKKDDLGFETVDRVISEGEKIGTLFYTILGGEPFIWEDLFKIFENHQNSYFQVFTNGTLLDEEKAKKLQKLGNVIVNFSIEGFEESTDKRRQKGSFVKIMEAMDLLKKYRVPFGYSICATRNNVEEALSDKFIDLMIEKGALVGWYFLYMPVGKEVDLNLMPFPKQRLFMKERRDQLRANKPIFLIDFWNDAPWVGGCIAGGRRFAHVNSNGDLEPCIFIHLAASNIKKTNLAEALNSPFFRGMRDKQPFSKNLYLPCQVLDNPEILKELVGKYHPYPTHQGAEELVNRFFPCLTVYSQEAKKLYQPLWEKDKDKFPERRT